MLYKCKVPSDCSLQCLFCVCVNSVKIRKKLLAFSAFHVSKSISRACVFTKHPMSLLDQPFSFYSEIAKGLMKYQPDIIISVHPLMQHVPLRVLRSKGLLKKIVFTTVVTDLSTCHPTWLVLFLYSFCFKNHINSLILTSYFFLVFFRFHKLVTRCYCPTTDVAQRALKAGLQQSQIKIFGLPVRPSFIKPVRPKVCLILTAITFIFGYCTYESGIGI